MGGVDGFTQKAHNYGYNGTTVKGYYDPSNDGKNTSTIGDEVNAMNHIFATTGADYGQAQDALKEAARSDNFYGVDDDANKWAGTSQVAGNVGMIHLRFAEIVGEIEICPATAARAQATHLRLAGRIDEAAQRYVVAAKASHRTGAFADAQADLACPARAPR